MLGCSSGTYRCQFAITAPGCSRLRLEARGMLAPMVERFVALRILQHAGLLRLLFGLGGQPQTCMDGFKWLTQKTNQIGEDHT